MSRSILIALLVCGAWALPAAAARAPDFRATTRAGEPVELAQFRGRFVLLDFWASWCGTCRSELPRLCTLEREIDDLVVLAVNVDAERAALERFAARVALPRRVVLDPAGRIADRFAIPALPWQVLVGPDGKIVRQGVRVHDGAAALRAEINRRGVTE